MKVFNKLNDNKNLAIALGFFDGIHIGHKKIISTLVQNAQKNKLQSAIITFTENPANYFSDETTLAIQSQKDKENIIEAMGVDYLYELDFEKFKNLTAADYIKNVLVKYFSPKYIIAGYNHTLGSDRQNAGILEDLQTKYKYNSIIVSEQKYRNREKVSSTLIRKYLNKGYLNAANALLGRNFSIMNSVVSGKKIARTLGYPTANLIWPYNIAKLPYGVYYGYVNIGDSIIPSLINWGTKPTLTNGSEEILEAHIYKYDKDIYGKIIKVLFVKKYRDQAKFSNIKSLQNKINEDYKNFQNWAKVKVKY